MTDIVEQLREGVWGRARRADAVIQAVMQEGADEIERMRAERKLERSIFNTALRRAQTAEAERDQLRSALKLAEDVLSRPPWSNNMLADGRHPHGVISAIRAALKEDRND